MPHAPCMRREAGYGSPPAMAFHVQVSALLGGRVTLHVVEAAVPTW
jgi:hypothetical protein